MPRSRGFHLPRRDLVTTVLGAVLLVATGVVLGLQYLEPNKRVIPVIIGIVVFGIAWRLDMLAGLGLLIMVLPFPKGTTFGNTNLALILLLLIIWLLRVSLRQSPPLQRTPVDVPIGGLLIAYILSFYMIRSPEIIPLALANTQLMIAGMLMFYLVVSNVRTERQLLQLHVVQVASLLSIALIAIYELGHPGGALVPGWIQFIEVGDAFMASNVRVGGPFFDYELLAEFCALNLLLVFLLFVRSRAIVHRVVLGATLALVTFVMFTTVTRGAVVSLALSALYLSFLVRRHIRFVPLVMTLALVVAVFFGTNFVVAHFTRSGDLLGRFMGTEFKGLVPDTRVGAWQGGWERFLESPILGHGPYYERQIGTQTVIWPHNGYLYVANLVGVVGLTFFVWMLLRLWFLSRPRAGRLGHPSYAEAYLLIANAQLTLFIIDQTKIDFLRNGIYQFQVWLMLASFTAAINMVARLRGATATAPPAVRGKP